MIELVFEVPEEGRKKIGDMIHAALAGSPAYINNEILLNTEKNITLIIGNDNENDMTLLADLRTIIKSKDKS